MKRCEKCVWYVVPILRKKNVFCSVFGNIDEADVSICPTFDEKEEEKNPFL